MIDLTMDVEETLDCLAYSKEGSVSARLIPLEQIITDLQKAVSELTKGLYFPFQIKVENWNIKNTYQLTHSTPILMYLLLSSF